MHFGIPSLVIWATLLREQTIGRRAGAVLVRAYTGSRITVPS
jgi:hypothetical protein